MAYHPIAIWAPTGPGLHSPQASEGTAGHGPLPQTLRWRKIGSVGAVVLKNHWESSMPTCFFLGLTYDHLQGMWKTLSFSSCPSPIGGLGRWHVRTKSVKIRHWSNLGTHSKYRHSLIIVDRLLSENGGRFYPYMLLSLFLKPTIEGLLRDRTAGSRQQLI